MRILVKFKNLFIRFFAAMRVFPHDVSLFGLKASAVIVWDKLFPPGKSPLYINTVYGYIERFCEPIIQKYKDGVKEIPEAKKALSKIPVWVCWWQGEYSMPPLVKTCFKRLNEKVPNTAEIHLITLENYREYVDIPDFIIKRFDSNRMTYTELSNVLRFELLSAYGGLWIDSTVYLTDEISVPFLLEEFYGQKMTDDTNSKREACRGMWSGFLIRSEKKGIIPNYVRDVYHEWWKKHDKVIDYVDFDYFLLAGYNNLPQIKELIDNVKPNNEDIFGLNRVLNSEFDKELFEKIKATNTLHKLSYKADLLEKTNEGRQTFYGYIMNGENDE